MIVATVSSDGTVRKIQHCRDELCLVESEMEVLDASRCQEQRPPMKRSPGVLMLSHPAQASLPARSAAISHMACVDVSQVYVLSGT